MGPAEFLHIEEFDKEKDSAFVQDQLIPYFSDLYKDLMVRSANNKHLDVVAFTEYTKLPGIINERIRHMFTKGNGKLEIKNSKNVKDEMVPLSVFIKNMCLIFIGDLESRMKFTFDM